MSAKRLYQLLLGSIGLCVAALLTGVYVSTAILKKQSEQLVEAKTNSAVLDQEQQQLNKARTDIIKYKALGEIAQNIVPQDKNQAQTVREIVAIAQANGINLGSITFPSSTLGGVGVGSGNAALSQLKPVKGIGGVYSLEIAIQSDTTQPSDYEQFINFLDTLEHNRRTALVNGITILPDPTKPNKLSFTLNVSEYLKP